MMTVENGDGWDVCQPGEVDAVVRRLKTRRKTAHLQAVGSLAMLLVGIGFLGYYFAAIAPAVDNVYAGISCSEMVQLAPRYFAGELDSETTGRIRKHLAQCHRCRERYEAMQARDKSIPKTSIDHSGRHYALNLGPAASPDLFLPPVLSVADF